MLKATEKAIEITYKSDPLPANSPQIGMSKVVSLLCKRK